MSFASPASAQAGIPAPAETIPSGASFLFNIQYITPDFQEQKARADSQGHWIPPNLRRGLRPPADDNIPAYVYRWRNGVVSLLNKATVPPNVQLCSDNECDRIFRCATVFPQIPDTHHFLAVPFDARRYNVRDYSPHKWLDLGFDHDAHPKNDSYTYSYLSGPAEYQTMAVRTNSPWVRNLFAPQHLPSEDTGLNAGLTGHLSYLLAVIALSSRPNNNHTVLTSCIRPGYWVSHNFPHGRVQYLGVVVTVWRDFVGNTSEKVLENLETGVYGPIFRP